MEGAEGGDPGSDLDADIALARWGAGDIAGASDVLERRQRQLNELYQKASAGSPGGSRSSTIEVSSLIAPLPPKVAAVRLLLTDGTDDPTAVADASGELTRSVNHLDGLREEAGVDAVARLGSLKRLLWLLMAMQASPGAIEDVAARIGRIEPLDETSQAIYNAAALATTSPVEAAAALQPFTGESSIAGVLLAQTMSSQGLNREAGHELLKVWQREPGSILGVLAGHRLGQMLGVQLPMGEQAAAMSEVVETLPGVYDRMAGEPSLAITMHVSGPSEVVPVFGPIVLEFEIANHLPDPLPISPSGPVRDLLLIQADADVPYADMKPGPPIMLDVATGLQLPGHGEVKASIDLRSTWVGAAVMGRPLHGASISAEAILNPRFSLGQTSQAPAAQPGMLGGKFASSEIRVDGQRVTDAWISQALDRIRRGTSTAATDAALLAQVLAEQDAPEGGIELDQNRAAEILAAIIELWPQLGPVSQAWLVTTFPRGDRLTRLWTLVESSTDPLIRRTLLMRILSQFGDPAKALDEPAVGESLVSDDLQIRQLAEWIEVTLQLQAERQFGSGRESGGS
jgi:hypothetical protein